MSFYFFKEVPGMKTELRFSLGLLRTLHFAWSCFQHMFFFFLLRKPNQLLITSPVLVCDSKLKQAPAILGGFGCDRWGTLVSKVISFTLAVFFFALTLISFPFLILLPGFRHLRSPLPCSWKRDCTFPRAVFNLCAFAPGLGIPQYLF